MVVVFPMIPWGFLWQRPQQILSRVAAQGFPVFYLAPTVDCSIHPGEIDIQNPETYIETTPVAANVFHLWCFSKENIDVHHGCIPDKPREAVRAALESFLGKSTSGKPIYFVQHPGWTVLVEELCQSIPGTIVYDCMDDHLGFQDVPEEAVQDESRLLKRAELVLASSEILLERARSENDNSVLLRNASEFEHFHEPSPNDELKRFRGKTVVGYYGSIADWFDFDLIKYLARERSQYEYLLIGADDHPGTKDLQQLSNVHLLGTRPYRELPGYLASFDVCMIPFKLLPLTLATNPVKFYEYLSAGKPVVSVRLPELEEYSNLCYLADPFEDFAQAIDRAVEEKQSTNTEIKRQRENAARENSWESRVAVLCKELEKFRPDISTAARAELKLVAALYQRGYEQVEEERNFNRGEWAADVARIKAHYERLFSVRCWNKIQALFTGKSGNS